VSRLFRSLRLPGSQPFRRGSLSFLPDVVDRMTPAGSIPADSDDLVSSTLRELQAGRESHG